MTASTEKLPGGKRWTLLIGDLEPMSAPVRQQGRYMVKKRRTWKLFG
jgi:hypothetical protein